MRIVCHLIFRKNSFTIGSIESDDYISKLVHAIKGTKKRINNKYNTSCSILIRYIRL